MKLPTATPRIDMAVLEQFRFVPRERNADRKTGRDLRAVPHGIEEHAPHRGHADHVAQGDAGNFGWQQLPGDDYDALLVTQL